MFDRFTERARNVMTLARQESQRLGTDYIGTEHILLGLAASPGGVSAEVIKNLGVDHERIRAEVERIVERGTAPAKGTQLPFTPRAKRVLELALEESMNLGHNYIGTEHLLLGLLRERDGPAAHVLENLGLRPEDVRVEVLELLGVERPVDSRRAEAAALDEALAAHVEAAFPGGGVFAGADARRSVLGKGFHVLVQWRPEEGKPPRASISVVAKGFESLLARVPAILELFAGIIEKEKGETGEEK